MAHPILRVVFVVACLFRVSLAFVVKNRMRGFLFSLSCKCKDTFSFLALMFGVVLFHLREVLFWLKLCGREFLCVFFVLCFSSDPSSLFLSPHPVAFYFLFFPSFSLVKKSLGDANHPRAHLGVRLLPEPVQRT
jgi:hypothetical protein